MEGLSRLALARIGRGLTQPLVAEHVGVDTATISRWERGGHQPYPRHVQKLCTLFGKSATELGLPPIEPEAVPHPPSTPIVSREKENGTSPAFTKFFQHDIELRLQCIVFDWLHRQRASHSCAMLQYRISQELEDYDSMTNEPRQNHEDVEITRRAALRHLGVFRK